MMLLPWFKLATTSLNIGTSATVGGFCSYCLFGGENKEEKQKIDEITLAFEKAKREFEEEKKKTIEVAVAELKAVETKVEELKKVEKCLEEVKKIYDDEVERLDWRSWFVFTPVTFKGEQCSKT